MPKAYFTRVAHFTNPEGIYFVEKRALLLQCSFFKGATRTAACRLIPGPIPPFGFNTKSTRVWVLFVLKAPPGIGPGIKVLQTSALPLGYGAVFISVLLYATICRFEKKRSSQLNRELKRITGIEPATSTLARSRSTK